MKKLSELERRHEDPEVLEGLFDLDHLTARLRRYEENPGDLGRRPAPTAVAQARVDGRRAAFGTERGAGTTGACRSRSTAGSGCSERAVGLVVHVLAELMENAVSFSRPPTPVEVYASRVGRGLAVEIEDRGMGMTAEEYDEANRLMADPPRMDVLSRAEDIRLGLVRGGPAGSRTRSPGGVAALVVRRHPGRRPHPRGTRRRRGRPAAARGGARPGARAGRRIRVAADAGRDAGDGVRADHGIRAGQGVRADSRTGPADRGVRHHRAPGLRRPPSVPAPPPVPASSTAVPGPGPPPSRSGSPEPASAVCRPRSPCPSGSAWPASWTSCGTRTRTCGPPPRSVVRSARPGRGVRARRSEPSSAPVPHGPAGNPRHPGGHHEAAAAPPVPARRTTVPESRTAPRVLPYRGRIPTED
ncbi:hypothetical protein ACRAWF_45390 [Streptomyces sp. L7]